MKHTRNILLTTTALLLAWMLSAPLGSAAQALLPQDNDRYSATSDAHLFRPSRFIRSQQQQQLNMARLRGHNAQYRLAVEQGDYARALAYTDSLILTTQQCHAPTLSTLDCYLNRARMLYALHRDSAACEAYDRALLVRDSVIHIHQDNTFREMQDAYELDRLALDRALLQADHHKTMLVSVALLLLVAALTVGFIYLGNRRTKRLRDKLLHEMHNAQQSEQKKKAFINSICHEVRTPLNCIAGFSELLCAPEITNDAHGEYCEIIRANRRQLRYLFDDMLEVAYLENLNDALPRSYVDLCTLCRTQMRTMKVRSPKPGVSYVETIPNENIGLVSCGKYLNLLLGALLNNAYKFTEQGSIRISCGRDGEQRVFIAIEDTGCGIPAGQHERVFERFTKLDTFSPGNGLGLYMCRLITRHLGGEIHIDPTCAGGLRIVVTLPRK